MKILVLSQYWYPENGVPQRRWAWLSKILVEAGHEVLVVAPPPHYARKIPIKKWVAKQGFRSSKSVEKGLSGESVIRCGFFPASNSITQRILNQASVALSMGLMQLNPRGPVRKFRPELVIGTVPALPTSVLTQVVANLHGAPYIIDLRDAWPDLLQESRNWNEATGRKTVRERVLSRGPLQVLTSLTGRAMNSALRKSGGVISTSERLERYLADSFSRNGKGPQPELTTVRNVFPPLSRIERISPREPETGELNVLYAGTLGRAQKLDNALKAMKIAQDSGLNIKLKLVGDGATWYALREEARELGIEAEFYPRGAADQLAEFYAWADTALVHLTDWDALKRAIPSKTYELMELGIHISGVLNGEAGALIEELDAGHVVAPEDPEALAQLWIDLARNRKLLEVSESGKKWVEEERSFTAPGNMIGILERVHKNWRRSQ
ncbi:glycosyltransferase family 4 protein [Corynebacterium casei]|uniref:glycosyltransferase family 4 protein n=1 Tax=Corynebacterium casei TaxID=160386 RepID=UPI003FD43D00